MSERLVVVMHIRLAFLFLLLEAQSARADGDAVAVCEWMLISCLAVDEDLVGAASYLSANDDAINKRVERIVEADVRVMARGARVVQDDAVVRRAANRARGLRYKVVLPLPTARICNFQ